MYHDLQYANCYMGNWINPQVMTKYMGCHIASIKFRLVDMVRMDLGYTWCEVMRQAHFLPIHCYIILFWNGMYSKSTVLVIIFIIIDYCSICKTLLFYDCNFIRVMTSCCCNHANVKQGSLDRDITWRHNFIHVCLL